MADSISNAASSELSPSYQHVTVKVGGDGGEPLTFQPDSMPGGTARHEEMSFNIKAGLPGGQHSSISGYSGNQIKVEESFHLKNSADPSRNSYNLATSGNEKNSI